MDAFLQAAIDEAQTGAGRGGHPHRLGSGDRRARSSAGGTTAGCNAAAPSCTPRWTAWKTAAGSRHATIVVRFSIPRFRPATCAAGRPCSIGFGRIVIGENQTFQGPEEYVRSRGVQLDIRNDPDCIRLDARIHRRQTRTLERRHRRVTALCRRSAACRVIHRRAAGPPPSPPIASELRRAVARRYRHPAADKQTDSISTSVQSPRDARPRNCRAAPCRRTTGRSGERPIAGFRRRHRS